MSASTILIRSARNSVIELVCFEDVFRSESVDPLQLLYDGFQLRTDVLLIEWAYRLDDRQSICLGKS